MLIVAAYDINTETKEGRRRLRRVAVVCKDFGVRVQKSVFECLLDETRWVLLRKRLLEEIDLEQDSLRLYFLDENARRRTEHHGRSKPLDLEEPLVL